MTILLFEPQLVSFGGHFHRYVRVIAAEARKRGESVAVATGKGITSEVQESLQAIDVQVFPVFPAQNYRLVGDRNKQIEHCETISRAALSAYEKLPDSRVTWLSGLPKDVEGVATFAEKMRRPFPFQMLNFATSWNPGVETAPAEIRQLLEQGTSYGMRLYAQTKFVADAASRECGQRFLPFLPILEFKVRGTDTRKRKPKLGLMNCVRPDKDVLSALRACRDNARQIDIVVHARRFLERDVFDKLLLYAEKIGAEVHRDALDPDIYNGIWNSLDAVMLSYNVHKYSRCGSGMFFEALSDAIVPIVPDQTSMAAVAREERVGVVYDAGDPAGLTNATKGLINDFDRLASVSREFAPVWRERNNPSRVLDLLETAWAS